MSTFLTDRYDEGYDIPRGSDQQTLNQPASIHSISSSTMLQPRKNAWKITRPAFASTNLDPSFTSKDFKRGLKTHLCAFMMFILFGVCPIALFFGLITESPWKLKDTLCQGTNEGAGMTSNSIPSGSAIQALFIVDALVSSMPFASAKFVDVVWDLCIGRGSQGLAWYISYEVFTKSLLRAIELSPTPYRSFAGVAVDGSSLITFWTLLADIRRHRSRRATFLFSYMIVSCVWILSLPTLLSAMTGYVSSSKMYIRADDNQLVDYADTALGLLVYDGERIEVANGTCLTLDEKTQSMRDMELLAELRDNQCPCLLSNGTLYTPPRMDLYSLPSYSPGSCTGADEVQSNATFQALTSYFPRLATDYSCAIEFEIEFRGKNYTLGRKALHMTRYGDARCYGPKEEGLGVEDIIMNSVCLPSNDESKYFWGFSSMLTAVVMILQFIWAVTMYGVWLDAMINSSLVKDGVRLSSLKAAFALTVAAEEKLGMNPEELAVCDKRDLKALDGKDAVVQEGHFVRAREKWRRRTAEKADFESIETRYEGA